MPSTEEMLTMLPWPASIMWRPTSCERWNTATRLISRVITKCSSSLVLGRSRAAVPGVVDEYVDATAQTECLCDQCLAVGCHGQVGHHHGHPIAQQLGEIGQTVGPAGGHHYVGAGAVQDLGKPPPQPRGCTGDDGRSPRQGTVRVWFGDNGPVGRHGNTVGP